MTYTNIIFRFLGEASIAQIWKKFLTGDYVILTRSQLKIFFNFFQLPVCKRTIVFDQKNYEHMTVEPFVVSITWQMTAQHTW